jgi:hypothetical protein
MIRTVVPRPILGEHADAVVIGCSPVHRFDRPDEVDGRPFSSALPLKAREFRVPPDLSRSPNGIRTRV